MTAGRHTINGTSIDKVVCHSGDHTCSPLHLNAAEEGWVCKSLGFIGTELTNEANYLRLCGQGEMGATEKAPHNSVVYGGDFTKCAAKPANTAE